MQQTENLNVAALDVMPSPDEVKARAAGRAGARTVVEGGARSRRSSTGATRACSSWSGRARSTIPPLASTARRLRALADEVSRTLYLVMRVYFEKPRTSTGWKGSSTTRAWTTPSASTRGWSGRGASCSR